MPNSTTILTIDQVKSPVDRVHFLNQECVSTGLATTFYTYLAGVVGIPLLFKTAHRYIPIGIEYKFATGAMVSMVISYFAGVHAKKKCEEDLKRQLAENLIF